MIILNPNCVCFSNLIVDFNYLFGNNFVNSEVFIPVLWLIVSYVFDVFKIVK